MLNVLKTVKRVVDKVELISINVEAVERFVASIRADDLDTSQIALYKHNWSFDNLVRLIFLFNTINFCFWAEKDKPKWSVMVDGKKLDGSTALFRVLEEKLVQNSDFTIGENLKKINLSDLKILLKGNVEIPMLDERLRYLNDVGHTLCEKYDGDFMNVFNLCDYDAKKLLIIVADNFSCFKDESTYKGSRIGFYKRAQLNVKMISDVYFLLNSKILNNLDFLTAFADYKVPQILRTFRYITIF